MTNEKATTRATIALMLTQSSASAGFLSMTSVNAVLMARLSGMDSLAGVPQTLILIGAAISAYFVGRMVARAGRKPLLMMGSLLGVAGALVAGAGVIGTTLLLFLPGLLMIGMARGAMDQGRYAAAAINPPNNRARAISLVVWGGTIGAVLGPLLVDPSGQVATSLGLSPFAGPPFVTAILLGVAGILIFVLLRGVDFRVLSRQIDEKYGNPAAASSAKVDKTHTGLKAPVFTVPAARAAMITMACAQAAMSLMMTIISLYMIKNGHTPGDVGSVITAHVLGMYALSPLVGNLADRIGRRNTSVIGIFVLAAACVLTPVFLPTPWIMFCEFLVGFGWSLCYISSGAMLTNALTHEQRAQSQGTSDVFVNVASAFGSLSSGFLLNSFNFWIVAFFGLCVSLAPLLAMLADRRGGEREITPQM
ncbi:MAG TPA: MFS transporter [Thermoflexales bacterium]|nr:MFS transporter [Thermoflexales bacterium]HQW34425.1 MFS transporter [Thermoflexales bacterium]HQX76325.1 MFS transporter [Thermoflexales bacterium]HQZ22600.1 MFS transporter [Thermoflexales bacterium]HRA00348.1 MFS transporter [Thermoflexales bacterium]